MKIPTGLKKSAVLCILKNQGSFLLLKRLKEPNKDMYTPVGGKLDPYENPNETAIRETREETGIEVASFQFCGILVESSPTKYNWINFVYVAEIEHQPPPPCNEGTLEWISFDNVLQVPTPKTDWLIYKYVLEGTPFIFNADFDNELNLLKMVDELSGKIVVENR